MQYQADGRASTNIPVEDEVKEESAEPEVTQKEV